MLLSEGVLAGRRNADALRAIENLLESRQGPDHLLSFDAVVNQTCNLIYSDGFAALNHSHAAVDISKKTARFKVSLKSMVKNCVEFLR